MIDEKEIVNKNKSKSERFKQHLINSMRDLNKKDVFYEGKTITNEDWWGFLFVCLVIGVLVITLIGCLIATIVMLLPHFTRYTFELVISRTIETTVLLMIISIIIGIILIIGILFYLFAILITTLLD